MKQWITNRYLCHMDTVIDHDDIVFLPHQLGTVCKYTYVPGESHQQALLKELNHEVRRSYRSGVLARIFSQSNLLDWQEEVEREGHAHHRVSGTVKRI